MHMATRSHRTGHAGDPAGSERGPVGGSIAGPVGGSIAARSAQAPVRAPPQGAATVVAVERATGDIVGRVVVFGLFGSIIGHLLRGESAVCTSRPTAIKRVSTAVASWSRLVVSCRVDRARSGPIGALAPAPVDPVPIDPVPVELVLAGRELTEPRLSPDGRTVAFVQRWGTRSAVTIVDVGGGPERMLTTSPDPRPGRWMGGGCFDWLADGSGVVYVGVDGELWLQPRVGPPRRLTTFERSCAAPADRAERVVRRRRDRRGGGLAGADRRGRSQPPAVSTTVGTRSASTRRSRRPASRCAGRRGAHPTCRGTGPHACRLHLADDSTASVQRWRPDGGAVQQPRHTVSGAHTCVHDGSGWLNVYVGRSSGAAGADRAGGAYVGHGSAHVRRGAGRASASRSAGTNSASAGSRSSTSNVLARRGSTDGGSIDVGRGVHGQVSWVDDSIVALRSGARTPTQIVRYDVDDVRTHGPRGRPRRRMGRASTFPSPSSSRSDTMAPSCTPAGTHTVRAACSCGCTAARRISGRSTSALASPTGGAAAGTCSWSTRGAPPATDAPISGR